MKTRKIIFIILGCILFLFQFLVYLGSMIMHRPFFKGKDISYLIGFNIWGIPSLIFFCLAYRTSKNIRIKKAREQVDSLLVDDRFADSRN